MVLVVLCWSDVLDFLHKSIICFFHIPLVVVVEASVLGLRLGYLKFGLRLLRDGKNTWAARLINIR